MAAHRVLVKFATPPTAQIPAAIKADTAADYFEPLGGAGWYAIKSTTLSVGQLLDQLRLEPGVLKAELDSVGKLMGVVPPRPPAAASESGPTPDDPFYPQQWALHNTGQCIGGICGTMGADIDAPDAWAISTGSKQDVVVDFDTGVDYDNPDLEANVWTAPHSYTISEGGNLYNCPQGAHGFNAIDYQSGCTGQVYDNGTDYGHGTITAGIIGAVGNNSLGVVGAAWNVTILPISICGNGVGCDEMTAITGIDAAMQIANQFGLDLVVGNFSHGGLTGSALEDEMTLAGQQQGMVFTASTGNECRSSPDDPASDYLSNEIAVAASDQNDSYAWWSTGNCSNGGGNIAAPGKNNYTTTLGDRSGNGSQIVGGTSIAAPYVAGALGLLESACPLPPAALIQTIEGTADQKPNLTAVATDGKRLNMGAALASCSSGAASTGGVRITLYQNTYNPDTGSISVTVAGRTASYDYDTSQDTAESVAQELSFQIDSKYVHATWTGGGNISVTTLADGPYTDYPLQVGVSNDCVPADECGRAPSITITKVISGGY